MPATDPEPENYSIDEMMGRLRSRGEGRSDGEAELVTREDGTQVYRMRKRKRRTRQPKKEKEKRQRRLRVAQVIAAVVMVAGTGLAFLAALIYLNSSAYQASVVEKIRQWSGAEPELTQFRASPVSAGAGAMTLTWPEGSVLESLKLQGVRGNLHVTSLFGGTWKGAEMVATNGGTLILRRPSGTSALPLERSGECPFQFRYRSPRFQLLMGGSKSPDLKLGDSEASLTVLDPTASVANLQLERGKMALDGWGEFQLILASLQFEQGGFRVGTIRLAPEGSPEGEIEISNPGKVVVDMSGGKTELPVRVQHSSLSSLVDPAFGMWLTAEVESPEEEGDGTITLVSGRKYSLACRIPFKATASSETRIIGLKMFGILAGELGEDAYENLRYDVETSGVIVRDGNTSGIEDLRLESRGRLVITGKIASDRQGVIDGVLEVGLPVASVNNASGALRSVFKNRKEGRSWATIRISGTADKPVDDLQKQLDAAATLVTPATGGAEAIEDAFRELTTPEER
ncbi:hypothetical protein [Luteolibacter marinus]|uniref:hypothetical protein n=1 Tax=Luteolibacter marinus TaxID=2776705 RepID=UPI00186910E3|nr:hypothetical protein [Luteolibacter marinus]